MKQLADISIDFYQGRVLWQLKYDNLVISNELTSYRISAFPLFYWFILAYSIDHIFLLLIIYL